MKEKRFIAYRSVGLPKYFIHDDKSNVPLYVIKEKASKIDIYNAEQELIFEIDHNKIRYLVRKNGSEFAKVYPKKIFSPFFKIEYGTQLLSCRQNLLKNKYLVIDSSGSTVVEFIKKVRSIKGRWDILIHDINYTELTIALSSIIFFHKF